MLHVTFGVWGGESPPREQITTNSNKSKYILKKTPNKSNHGFSFSDYPSLVEELGRFLAHIQILRKKRILKSATRAQTDKEIQYNK